MTQLKLEIGDAVFMIDDIVDILYGPLSKEQVSWLPDQRTLSELYEALEGASGGPERHSYHPLRELFAGITSSMPSDQRMVVFSVYDRTVEDRPDGSGNLKPDLAGTKDAIQPQQRVPWRLIIYAVEVKDLEKNGFIQSLTYARCMLEVGDKWFAPVLYYNQVSQSLYGVFVTRFGVFVTSAMDLVASEGQKACNKMILRMCSASCWRAGLEPSKLIDDDGRLCLSRGPKLSPSLLPPTKLAKSWLTLDHVAQRIAALGRATRVYRCDEWTPTPQKRQPSDNPRTISHKTEPAERRLLVDAEQRAAAASRRSARTLRADQPAPGKQPEASPTPEKSIQAWIRLITDASVKSNAGSAELLRVAPGFICKSAWLPFPRHDVDEQVVKGLSGLHGCPVLVKSVVARHPKSFAKLGERILSGKARRSTDLWKYSTTGSLVAVFQPRVHVYSFYQSVGHPIRRLANNPRSMAHAVKDTMLGLAISFFKQRRIHRDVTKTNVLTYEPHLPMSEDDIRATVTALASSGWPELEGLLENDSGFKQLFRERHAFVNDFEHSVLWNVNREVSVARSGTPEYMSYQLLVQLAYGRWRIHTLLDDLESCIWVPFHDILDAFPELRSQAEQAMLTSFATDDYTSICNSKSHLLRLIPTDYQRNSALASTWPLWSRLIPIANSLQQEMVTALNKYQWPLSAEQATDHAPPGSGSSQADARPETGGPQDAQQRAGSLAGATTTGDLAVLFAELEKLSRKAIICYLLAIKDAIKVFEDRERSAAI
ncbi:hypothetical protein AURDEDRAFT_153765 [Auricularia subglabra TFB-10046 SS5]|uniref:Fungal-type protein kinase domain-containing protein n=1 Tax=Auricularia subglabra (strain TFB-10046 / SS5) TaxID=717982 RepID=J0WVS6_AURST|nr:hypothetical protein AURDEDRAFT_153765 [Auricularia subglabra TFB-10046 SS5]